MGMQGFDGKGDLALGEVYGVRWWGLPAVQAQGRGEYPIQALTLRGVRDIWHPGENTAACKSYLQSDRHEAPDERCTSGCGFWAYWKPELASPAGGEIQVMGVIKGYGYTLIGDLGFRCRLAKIAGLWVATKQTHVVEHKSMVPGYRFAPPVAAPGGARWRGAGAADTYKALGGRGSSLMPHSYQPVAGFEEHTPTFTKVEEDYAAQAALEMALQERYQVPVYTTREALLMCHPPTTDYLPPPPDPDEINRELAELLQSLQANSGQLAAAIQAMMPHLSWGADALKQIMDRKVGS